MIYMYVVWFTCNWESIYTSKIWEWRVRWEERNKIYLCISDTCKSHYMRTIYMYLVLFLCIWDSRYVNEIWERREVSEISNVYIGSHVIHMYLGYQIREWDIKVVSEWEANEIYLCILDTCESTWILCIYNNLHLILTSCIKRYMYLYTSKFG